MARFLNACTGIFGGFLVRDYQSFVDQPCMNLLVPTTLLELSKNVMARVGGGDLTLWMLVKDVSYGFLRQGHRG